MAGAHSRLSIRAVTNFDRNPSRVIFGGGSPALRQPARGCASRGTEKAVGNGTSGLNSAVIAGLDPVIHVKPK